MNFEECISKMGSQTGPNQTFHSH